MSRLGDDFDHNNNSSMLDINESPTVLMIRQAVLRHIADSESLKPKVTINSIAKGAGLEPKVLYAIMEPGARKEQKIGCLVDLIDRLNAAGVSIYRNDICEVILNWQNPNRAPAVRSDRELKARNAA